MATNRMTRRDVFVAGACALSTGLLIGAEAHGVRFGVRTPLPKVSLRERAMLVKQLGYDGIELGPEWLNQPVDAIQEQLDGTGAAVSAVVGSLQLLNTDPLKRAEAVATRPAAIANGKGTESRVRDRGACVRTQPVSGSVAGDDAARD